MEPRALPDLEQALADLVIAQLLARPFGRAPVRPPQNPLEAAILRWRRLEASVDVAAVAIALAHSEDPDLRVLQSHFQRMAESGIPGLVLDRVSLATCAPAVAAMQSSIEQRKAELLGVLRQVPLGTPVTRARVASVLSELGRASEAEAILDEASGDDPVLAGARIDLLRDRGRFAEALDAAIAAARHWPGHRATAMRLRKLAAQLRRYDALAVLGPAKDAQPPSRQALEAVADLVAQGKRVAALEAIWNLREPLFSSGETVIETLKILISHLPRALLKISPALAEALATLPPVLQIELLPSTGGATPARLAAVASAIDAAEEPDAWPKLARATFEAAPPRAVPVEDRAAADWLLARCLLRRFEVAGEAARRAGYRVPRVDLAGLRRTARIRDTWREGAFLSYADAAASLTPRGRQFVETVKAHGRGAFVFSTHLRQDVGLQKQLMLVALSAFGLECLHMRRQSDESGHAGEAILAKLPLPPRYLNVTQLGPIEVAVLLAEMVRGGGVAHVPVDYAWDVVDVAVVPWFLRPYELAEFTGRIALLADGDVAFGASFADAEGRFAVDFNPVPKPPAGYGLRTRAVWLMQRLGRRVRDSYASLGIPLGTGQIVMAGGVPAERALTPVAGYLSEHPAAAKSLFGRLLLDPAFPLDRPAFRSGDDLATFDDLRRRALASATMIMHFQELKPEHARAAAFRDQHRVLAILPPGEALLELGLGALAAGSMFSACQTDADTETIRTRIASFAPDLIIAAASVADRLDEAGSPRPKMLICDDAGDAAAVDDLTYSFPPADALPAFDATRPALVVFTSGSTGKPKAITLSHRLHASGYDWRPPREDSRHAAVVRWDTVGFAGLLTTLREGSLLDLPPREIAAKPAPFAAYLAEHRITALSAPSTVWHGLADTRSFTSAELPAFRGGVAWGERLSQRAVETIAQKFPSLWLALTYGATEASHISSRVLVDGGVVRQDNGTIIEPKPGVRVRVVDEHGNEVTEPGVIGRLEVAGDNVMLGTFDELFAHNPAIAEMRPQHSLLVGDLVSPAGNGTFALIGRDDSIVKIGGRRISLVEIENAAERLDEVKRAVAVARSGDVTSEICLAVETTREILSAVVAARVGALTVPEARPRRVLIVPELPLLPAGKIDRAAVAALFDGSPDEPYAPEPLVAVPPEPVPPPRREAVTADAVVASMAAWLNRHGSWEAEPAELAATPLLENYFDSILQLELLLHLEKTFGVSLADAAFSGEGATFASLAEAIATACRAELVA